MFSLEENVCMRFLFKYFNDYLFFFFFLRQRAQVGGRLRGVADGESERNP